MEVKTSYKKTEVGMIPEDWKIIQLSDLNPFITSGSRGWANYYAEYGDLFVRITNLTRESIYLDLMDCKYVNLPVSNSEGIRTQLKENDVLVSITADIGIIGYVDDSIPVPSYINQHIALVRFDPQKAYGKFVSYFLASETSQQLFRASTDNGAKAGMTLRGVQKIQIALPPTAAEQRNIATVLSDTDAYITALEKLIAKKRAIKKGAMQELLTGKRRLPGFSGEWEMKKFTDICEILSSLVDPKLGEYSVLPHIGNENIAKSTGKLLPYKTAKEDGLISGKYYFTAIDVLYGKINPQFAKACFPEFTGLCSADMYPLTTKPGFAPRFLLYMLLSEHFTNYTVSVSARSGMPKVNREELNGYERIMPRYEEQIAIADILSDMDVEIDALAAKLNKVRSIRQGMMQALLTGRIRLVGEEVKAASEAKPTANVIELPKHALQPAAAQTGGHNQQFDDAVMIAGIVNVLNSEKYPLGRKKVQKCLYLLRRYQDESTAAFKKKAAGPYADEVRYKGGEPIALRAKYITTTTTKGKGTTFARGSSINKALGYITSWGKQLDIQWVTDKLKFKKVDELELLATVDMAICDLEEATIPVSVASIKNLIAASNEWKEKLEKPIFSDANIARAIFELPTLLQGGK